jgi:hypothetical protein
VSNAVTRTTAQIAQSEGTRHQNAPCVAGIIRQTTKDVNITTTLSKETILTELPRHSDTNNTAAYNFTPSPYNPPHQQQQQRSYTDVASNNAQLTEEPISIL